MHVDPRTFNTISLCSGGGGLDLGLRLAVPAARTIAYVEIEAYACEILATQMQASRLDAAPIWTDLKTFSGRPWRGLVDCLIGGYPCQPFSVAGKQRGAEDPRHLWPYIGGVVAGRENIIEQLGYPEWLFFENVANHLRVGYEEVHTDLQSMGYRVATGLFTASEVGATHQRERLFILAHAERRQQKGWSSQPGEQAGAGPHVEPAGSGRVLGHAESSLGRGEGRSEHELWRGGHTITFPSGSKLHFVGNTDEQGLEGRGGPEYVSADEGPTFPPSPEEYDRWASILAVDPACAPATESNFRRVVDGLAPRLDRLRLLGNGVVPLAAAYAFRTLASALRGEMAVDEEAA